MSFPNIVNLSDEEIYNDDSTAVLSVGQRVETPNGRTFRYALAGGTALVAGLLQQSSTQGGDTANDTLTIATSVSVNDTSVAITNGTTTWTLDELKDGALIIERVEETGSHYYRIGGNTAEAAGSAAMTITLTPGVKFNEALTAGTAVVQIAPSPWSKVIVFPVTPSGLPAGFAMVAVTAAQHGYLQTHGFGAVKMDSGGTGTPVLGEAAAPSDTSAGALGGQDVDVNHPQIGIFGTVISDDVDFVNAWIMID